MKCDLLIHVGCSNVLNIKFDCLIYVAHFKLLSILASLGNNLVQ